MSDISDKLYNFDEQLVNDCYFDRKKFLISIPPKDFYTQVYGKAENEKYDLVEIYTGNHLIHEYHHYLCQLATPICFFDNIFYFSSLIRISYFIKIHALAGSDELPMPFCEHLDEYPAFITSNYVLSG